MKVMTMMTMMKKLMLILILGMIMNGPAAPILAYAGDGNDQGQNEDYDGDVFIPPPGCCIQ
jgi:hypothetical protein